MGDGRRVGRRGEVRGHRAVCGQLWCKGLCRCVGRCVKV
jgi:hypothetical protein